MLKINNLRVNRDNKEILKGLDLEIERGKVHALMGPNGSGKSTLAAAMMGHPEIEVTDGTVQMDQYNLLDMEVDERARKGLFLAFQYPREIPGVPYLEFLRLAYNQIQKERQGPAHKDISPYKFKRIAEEKMNELDMDVSFLDRTLNEGFSGGEKKKSEILQMAILEPKYAVLDETDSGLDVSALKVVAKGAKKVSQELNIGILVITHYPRILDYLEPDTVHVLIKGQIVRRGDKELAHELDSNGYEHIVNSG